MIILSVMTFACNQSRQDSSEADLVRQSYENFQTAVVNGKGKEALKYVDDKTIDYYSSIARYTQSADSLRVDGLPLRDKMMVLFLRQLAPREQLLSFDGKTLFIYAVNVGMVGAESFEQNSIDKVYIKGAHATGEFKATGQNPRFPVQFHKSGDQWKVDLTSTFTESEAALKRSISRSGQSENEFFLSSLEDVAGKKIGREIWEPLK